MSKSGLGKLWDVLSQIVAVIVVVVYAVLIVNANFQFIPAGTVLEVLDIIRTYGSLAVLGLVGLEATSKWPFLLKLIFLILCAVIVIFLFFPGTYANLIGMIAQP